MILRFTTKRDSLNVPLPGGVRGGYKSFNRYYDLEILKQ